MFVEERKPNQSLFSAVRELKLQPTKSKIYKNDCWGSQLVPATPANLAILNAFLEFFSPAGGTNFQSGLELAYSVISNTQTRMGEFNSGAQARPAIILFMTDGEDPTYNNNFVITQTSALGTKAPRIFPYAFGSEVAAAAKSLLTGIAQATHGPVGGVTLVPDGGNLRTIMGSYYNYPAFAANVEGPIFTTPYSDSLGLGQVITAAIPFINTETKETLGVFGVDLVLSELFSPLRAINLELSYAFVIDRGRTFVHPPLPLLSDTKQSSGLQSYVDIAQLETSASFLSVRASMLANSNGSATIPTDRSLPRGGPRDGVYTLPIQATYYWSHLENTSFIVCFVHANTEHNVTEWRSAGLSPAKDVYHRLDLAQQNQPVCQTSGATVATKNASSYFVIFAGFQASAAPAGPNGSPTLSQIEGFNSVVAGTRANNAFTRSALNDIQATRGVAGFWQSTAEDVSTYVISRYVGTPLMFRKFPGGPSSPNYDPSTRPWYRAAVAAKGSYGMSPPYQDADGNGLVLTLSKALLRPNGDVAAVLGMDFSLSQVRAFLQKAVPECAGSQKCLLMDNAGYIVDSGSNTQQGWIGESYKWIADDLIVNQVLKGEKCNLYPSAKIFSYYSPGRGGTVSLQGQNNCGGSYSLHTIENSSLFLVLVAGADCSPSTCQETCPSCSQTCPSCTPADSAPTVATCPCFCELAYSAGTPHFTKRPGSIWVYKSPEPSEGANPAKEKEIDVLEESEGDLFSRSEEEIQPTSAAATEEAHSRLESVKTDEHHGNVGSERDEEITTIFCSGYPHDVKMREIFNLFRLFTGFRTCALNLKGRVPIAFASFDTRDNAVNAKEKLQGLRFDLESSLTMRLELAKSNMKAKKKIANGVDVARLYETHVAAEKSNGQLHSHTPTGSASQASMSAAPSWDGSSVSRSSSSSSSSSHIKASAAGQQPLPPGLRWIPAQQLAQVASSSCLEPQRVSVDTPWPGAGPSSATGACSTLFVANLGNATEDEVRKLFEAFAGFRQVRFKGSPKGGVAFVDFESEQLSGAAMGALQGHKVLAGMDGIRIEYAKACMVRHKARNRRQTLPQRRPQPFRHATTANNSRQPSTAQGAVMPAQPAYSIAPSQSPFFTASSWEHAQAVTGYAGLQYLQPITAYPQQEWR
eukprot:g12004.t1